jgi:hypothetical protein
MRVLNVILLAPLVACGGAAMQTIKIVNKTDRPIEAYYVYPSGADKGASRGTLAPQQSTQITIKGGHVEVQAVSAKIKFDDHHRDQPTASQSLELTHPTEVDFYDSNAKPEGLDRPNVIGVSFVINTPPPPPPAEP